MTLPKFIQDCVDKQYAVMNCDEKKRPELSNWSKRPSEDFYNSVCIGNYTMRMGLQENGDYVISLDFDIMEKKKNGKYKINKITQNTLEEWKGLNEEGHGLYISSTQNNMGNLVNITNCPKLIEIIGDIGKSKFQDKKAKETLEILCSSLCVLPPTKTVCKVNQQAIIARTFRNEEHPFLILEPNTPQYDFIYNYCDSCKKSSCKYVIKRDRRSKDKKEIYNNIHSGKYIVKSIDHGLELLSLLSNDRYCYDSWWKIGVACMNSFEREFAEELFEKWSEKDPSGNYDGNIPYDDWCDTEYDGLNWNMIMKWIEYDAQGKMMTTIWEYNQSQSAEKYEGFKKYFENRYAFCKDPQVYFYKSKKEKYLQKTRTDIVELERHNIDYFKDWEMDENRKMYEMSDYVPVKHIKDPQIFNTFRGYDWWKWDTNWYEIVQKEKGNNKALFSQTMKWWNKYIYNVCGKDYEMVRYVKCIIGNILFNPQNPTKVMLIFQGIEGTGKSFLLNIIKSLLGGLNVASSPCPLKELFGQFNEPLLTAQVVALEENNKKNMKVILDELKSKITDATFNVNCKNEKNFVRTNTLQWLSFMNELVQFAITSTNRRFTIVKTSMDLAIQNKENTEFWDWGYNVVLKNTECLKIITADIKNVFEEMDGYNLDYKVARPMSKLQVQVVRQGIPPIFQYLQHLISKPTKDLDTYDKYDALKENKPKPKHFSQWFANNNIMDKDSFLPLSSKVMKKLKNMKVIESNAKGFWIINMNIFRRNLNHYISEKLDKKGLIIEAEQIECELHNFFECEKKHFDKINYGGEFRFVFNPRYTKELLKKYRYYIVENDDCEKTNEEGVKFNIFEIDDDDDSMDEDESEEENEEPKFEYTNIIIKPETVVINTIEPKTKTIDIDSENEFQVIEPKPVDTDSDSDSDSDEEMDLRGMALEYVYDKEGNHISSKWVKK